MDEQGPMSVESFVDRYYKADRLRNEKGRRERIIEDRKNDLRLHGSALISRHDSTTGEQVVLYDPARRPAAYLRWAATSDDEPAEAS